MTRDASTRSVRRRKRRGLWLILGSSLVLVGLVAVAVFVRRPESDDQRFARLWEPGAREQMTETEREELRRQWKQLDPETKKRVNQIVFHQELDRARQEFARKSLDEQKAWVDGEIVQMRERVRNLSREERAKIEQQLNAEEGQTYLKNIFTSYHQELSARERAVLEPLAREFIIQLETFQ